MEVWKDIPGYEGQYQASTNGNIRSLDRDIILSTGVKQHRKGRVLKPIDKIKPPYSIVQLGKNRKNCYIHVLVALTFLGPRPINAEIRHLDCNSYNNRLSNLKYGTKRENSLDPWLNGRYRKLSSKQVIEIKKRLTNKESTESIAKTFGISSSMVRRIRRGGAFSWLKEYSQ